MMSFIKKDILVYWRDRKEVLISLLAPILIIIVLNLVFSGITFDDAGDMDIYAGLVVEDDEVAGLAQFEETLRDMDMSDTEMEAMMQQASAMTSSELILSFFDDPEISDWIHTREMNETEAKELVKNGELDAVIKIQEDFTYDVLGQVMLGQPANTSIHVQIEDHSIETNILSDMIDNYMETLNFQFAIGAVAEGQTEDAVLPQGGREVIQEDVVEIDLAQYFTAAMSTLFALFIATTVAAKTETEKRERVFNRILLTDSRPFSYLMGKIISTFCLAWVQLMIVFFATDLLLGIFPGKSAEFWLGIIVIVTFFSFVVAGLSAIFTSLMLRLKNVNAANVLSTIFIMLIAALGGNFFPLEGSPEWLQAFSGWMPTGITISLFTELLQNGDAISFAVPLMKQSGYFLGFLLIGILMFPERGKV